MKKLILLFVAILISIAKMAAQEAHITSTGVHFGEPVTDKQWDNSKREDAAQAKYKEYNGLTYVTLTTDKDTDIYFAYDVKVNEGRLQMEITDSQGNTLLERTFRESDKNTAEVTLIANKEYKIKFTGDKTSGSYWCQWLVKK